MVSTHSVIIIGQNLASTGGRYEITASFDDLDQAIATHEKVAKRMSIEHVDYLPTVGRLLAFSLYKCEATNTIIDLNRVIHWSGELLKASKIPDTLRPLALLILGTVLLERNELSSSLNDLDRSVSINEQSLHFTDTRHLSRCYYNLGKALCHRYKESGSPDDLERALLSCQQAKNLLTPLDRFSSGLHEMLSWLESRGRFIEVDVNTKEAVVGERRTFDILPSNCNPRFSGFGGLATELHSYFQQPATIQNLDRPIKWSERALRLLPPTDYGYSVAAETLGNLLLIRAVQSGFVQDLKRSIDYLKRAVKGMSNDPTRRGSCLGTLSLALHLMFMWTNEIGCLEEAIWKCQAAAKLIPDGHRAQARTLNNLGSLLINRYKRVGATEDLNEGIAVLKMAIEKSSQDKDFIYGSVGFYRAVLHERYKRMGKEEDLEEALRAAQEAFDILDPGHHAYPAGLSGLAVELNSRYLRNHSAADLERAITLHQNAINSAPPSHPLRASLLFHLAESLKLRFQSCGSTDDLDRAIGELQHSLGLNGFDSPSSAESLGLLGELFQLRFQNSSTAHARDDFHFAVEAYESASEIEDALPLTRIGAAAACGMLVASTDPQLASKVLRRAVHLLPLICPRSLNQSDQQYSLSKIANIPSRAAALSLNASHNAFEALKMLETGRGIIAGLQLDSRYDVSVLHSVYPAIANRFNSLRNELDLLLPQSNVALVRIFLQTILAQV